MSRKIYKFPYKILRAMNIDKGMWGNLALNEGCAGTEFSSRQHRTVKKSPYCL